VAPTKPWTAGLWPVMDRERPWGCGAIIRRSGGGEREAGGAEREVSAVDLDERYEVEKRGSAETQPRPGRRG